MKANPSPLQAIRAHCLSCCLGSAPEVRACTAGKHCTLHQLRLGHRPEGMESVPYLRIIAHYCRACGEGTYGSAESCNFRDCNLWTFRLGKNPNRTPRTLTDEQRQAARERLARARGGKNA